MTGNTLRWYAKRQTLDEVPPNFNVPATVRVYEHQEIIKT
jgi:hypothetical protein